MALEIMKQIRHAKDKRTFLDIVLAEGKKALGDNREETVRQCQWTQQDLSLHILQHENQAREAEEL